MRFDWDETKNAINLRKHRVGFDTAALVFDDPLHLMALDREVDREVRWQTMGMADGVLLLLVVHTRRRGGRRRRDSEDYFSA